MSGPPRIGVASLMQESNTFAVGASTLEDFACNGLHRGAEALSRMYGTNTELAGACDELARLGAEVVPLFRAWAMSGPPVERGAFEQLLASLERELTASGPLDGIVLALHGALCVADGEAGDAAVVARVRELVGEAVVVGVCLDLHANVTDALLEPADFVIGYRTYPHVDQADTGRRAARLVHDTLLGRCAPVSVLAKRPLLVPAETSSTSEEPVAGLRRAADELQRDGALDASLFLAQPWLDVPDLGFAAVVTTDGDAAGGRVAAERLADLAWAARAGLDVPLHTPTAAIAQARRREGPVLLSESSDSPTAGATGDSPAMVRALLDHGAGLTAYVTVVDRAAVAACAATGVGADVDVRVGASIDARFHAPVPLRGTVTALHDGPITLAGPVWAGMEVSIGRAAVIRSGSLHVLVSERPPSTFDVATFRALGLEPAAADVIVVRSATLFRAGFAEVMRGEPLFLDIPGPSTPRLSHLTYVRAPRPLYPLEDA
ncbi:M81 family metallopeptidase [Conexibacter arvalis]|uniref:Microcystin degradation protein MlrC n=1 Tax=Conexibacter arvalis TaxID=912552 RepID=A0A840IDV9_9ACTN|nr:M81 family metallopeptidase [Conexibacter arvalis]MBB4662413.1 microcystin degradation protein MlrC [Conexibacter arvalis]